MSILRRTFSHMGSGSSTGKYYKSMNKALQRLNNEYTMLHYPMYRSDEDSFLQSQTNLTDFCMSLLPAVEGKTLLEVGCGNGIQAHYIKKEYNPQRLKAVDLNAGNIEIAIQEARIRGEETVEFSIDDAHKLTTVEDNSVDVLVNIESAFHYPEKPVFLQQMYRVLKPGGTFVIADILTTNKRQNRIKSAWKRRMSYFHWPMESYESELEQSNFKSIRILDITPEIIEGFRGYRKWLREMESRHFLEDMVLKLYYTIHTRINMYLLKTRRKYCVVVGVKPSR